MIRILLAVALLAPLPEAAAETRAWNFRVLLDEREIGRHRFTLSALGDERELRSEARFDVRVLFLTAYRYTHAATERWRGDCLHALVSRTETNGEREAVNAERSGERLLVERAERRDEHEGCVMSFAYWNPQILKSRRLLNSQTGELQPVTVTPRGEETIEVRGRPQSAQRHRLSAPQLTIDLWYAGGEWVALESSAEGGRRLRYQLM
jgi:hypothetical protein